MLCRGRILLHIETIWDACTFLYSLFVLEHRPAHSVPVYNTLCLAQSRHRIIALFFPLSTRVRLKSLVTPVTNPPAVPLEPRWPITVCVVTSRPNIVQAALAEPSRITHTHTHTHTLSLSPAGGRAINNRQSASPVFTPSYYSFELSRGLSVCDIHSLRLGCLGHIVSLRRYAWCSSPIQVVRLSSPSAADSEP